ncbi:MAG: hypothetical protein Q9222_002970 [Ikaeria aurantiellina]
MASEILCSEMIHSMLAISKQLEDMIKQFRTGFHPVYKGCSTQEFEYVWAKYHQKRRNELEMGMLGKFQDWFKTLDPQLQDRALDTPKTPDIKSARLHARQRLSQQFLDEYYMPETDIRLSVGAKEFEAYKKAEYLDFAWDGLIARLHTTILAK